MPKRILLFSLALYLIVMTTLLITTLTGLKNFFSINDTILALILITWGTLGALLTLIFSKALAKNNLTILHFNHATQAQKKLLALVQKNAQKVGLKKLPEVGVYYSPEINVYVTGPTKNHALLAVSSGLLLMLNNDEIDSIIAHEMAQIANGDMVTITLLQGVLNAFTLFFSSIVTYFISLAITQGKKNVRTEAILALIYSVLAGMFAIIFTIPSRAVVAAYSRWREYRADEVSVELTGRRNMLAALQCLQRATDLQDETTTFLNAYKITQRSYGCKVFSMQATLEKRIRRLQKTPCLASADLKH